VGVVVMVVFMVCVLVGVVAVMDGGFNVVG
jgi:hypothetical protein